MKEIGIGIVGAGYIGEVHSSVLVRDERVRLTYVHDVVAERAQRLAQTFGCQVANSVEEVIANCDAIYVTTPNTKHVAIATAAAAAGRHVFCEKPMATNLPEARSVLATADKSTGVFQVGHNRRFAPVYATLKRMLSDKHTAHSAHVKMNRGELLNPEWVSSPKVTGGFLYETTIHMFDMMRFLFGEIDTLIATGSQHEYPEIDDFSVLLKFNNGLHATFASSADASWLFPFERLEVFCHHSTLVTREMETLVCSEGIDGRLTEHSMHHLSKEEKWGYLQEDRAFIDAITTGVPVQVSALDGFKSVELVEACYASVRSGKPFSLQPNE